MSKDEEEPTLGDDEASEIDETGRNLTQQRLDEEGGTSAPVDVPWEGDQLPAGEVDDREAEARGSI